MEDLAKTRAKMAVNNALNTRNGPNTESLHQLSLNSKVLVYREPGNWTGPFTLLSITGETCKVRVSARVARISEFRSTHVKPFFEQPVEQPVEQSADEIDGIDAPKESQGQQLEQQP